MIHFIKKRLKALYKHYRYKIYYPRYYKSLCKQPVQKGKVLFLEMRFTQISNSLQLLYDQLSQDDRYQVDTAFVRFNFSRGKEYHQYVMDFIEKLAVSEYVVLDEASLILSSLPLRQETMAINVWHACGAFKKFGRSTGDKIFGSSHKELDKYPNYANLNLVTVSSPDIIWAYEEAMHLPSGIVEALGVSRTDIFFDQDFLSTCRDKVYDVVPEAKGKKIMLYAPTFRGRVSSATGPDEIDFLKFKEIFGEDYVLLCKHHPFVKELPLIPAEASDFARDVTNSLTIDELLSSADICISDYSSLVFEYSLFDKPMIFYAYDYDDYCDWRGFYYNYDALTPGPIVKTQEELIQAIQNIDTDYDLTQVKRFRKQFMGSCDGNSTKRLIEKMDLWGQSH